MKIIGLDTYRFDTICHVTFEAIHSLGYKSPMMIASGAQKTNSISHKMNPSPMIKVIIIH